MNKIIFILITFFLNNCSFNENSKIWENKEIKSYKNKKVIKTLSEEKKVVAEFNKGVRLDLSSLRTSSNQFYNQNNFGSQNYN